MHSFQPTSCALPIAPLFLCLQPPYDSQNAPPQLNLPSVPAAARPCASSTRVAYIF
ncbi:hypothetical protein BDZ91DRAFT_714174 [Kalaharituber pfeilii]|nr:hypothetical protein BDZ91DRAFT_714174 [Kalaharituber pfeilii]